MSHLLPEEQELVYGAQHLSENLATLSSLGLGAASGPEQHEQLNYSPPPRRLHVFAQRAAVSD